MVAHGLSNWLGSRLALQQLQGIVSAAPREHRKPLAAEDQDSCEVQRCVLEERRNTDQQTLITCSEPRGRSKPVRPRSK